MILKHYKNENLHELQCSVRFSKIPKTSLVRKRSRSHKKTLLSVFLKAQNNYCLKGNMPFFRQDFTDTRVLTIAFWKFSCLLTLCPSDLFVQNKRPRPSMHIRE